jgi:hypothetical protein
MNNLRLCSEYLRRRFDKGDVGGAVIQVFLCRKVRHPWVNVRRQPTFVAAAVVVVHITSKSQFVHHAVTAKQPVFVNSTGQRSPTVLRLEAQDMFLSRNGYKASSIRWS